MSMMICHGNPTMTGRYAVYVDDYAVPTKFLTWLCEGDSGRWLTNLKEEAHTVVNGWIGPFPSYHFDKPAAKPSLEFDL